jgi:hypothetical protein
MSTPRIFATLRLLRISWMEVPALCLGNAVGFMGAGSIPLWVAALLKADRLSAIQVGWLASGESFCLAGGVLATSAWGRRASPRHIAVTAAAVIAIANAIAMFPWVEALIVGRLLSGFAMGALLAPVTRIAVRRSDAQRVLSLMLVAMVLLIMGVYVTSSTLIGRFGPAGLFAFMALAAVVSAFTSLLGLPNIAEIPAEAKQIARGLILAPLLGCLGLAVVFTGQSMIWTYIMVIGNALGFDGRTLGVLFAVVKPLAMLGPIAAHTLGERAGLLLPLLFGLVLLVIDCLLVVNMHSPVLYGLSAETTQLSLLFCVPYAIAFVGRLDLSGRFAAAAPAFMMIGGSLSPMLGSKFVGMGRFHLLSLIAALCVSAGFALFLIAAWLRGMKVSLRKVQDIV